MTKLIVRLFFAFFLILEVWVIGYLTMPALTLHDALFRAILLLVFIEILLFEILMSGNKQLRLKNNLPVALVIVPIVIIVGITVINLFHGKLFRATDYANLITVEEKDFEEDFFQMDEAEIPLMDRDTAVRLGDRRIGSMTDLVSQFVPAPTYTQINVADQPLRVTPLEYAGFIQWLNNKDEGIPSYLTVNMLSGEVEVVDVEGGIKYSDSESFGRNVKRHLRKNYPTVLFQKPSFELDDSGHPHYVATTYENTFFMRYKEPSGVIVLDAVTGETAAYGLDDSPNWIDRVYSAKLILDQLNDNGQLKGGIMNSLFQKRGVTQTTKGYNYLPINDDMYLYTGVTSVNRDASNIGFYLVNLRTKEAHFYPVTSADEHSAMSSAEGSLQQMRFTSTFPLLLKLNDRPYYLSSLKDDSGLVRSHALVDAQDYQKVLTDTEVDGLIAQLFGRKSSETPIEEVETDEDLNQLNGEISNISDAVISGNTVYYLMVDGTVFKANISLHDQLPFVKIGDVITGNYNTENVIRSLSIEQK